MSYNDDDWAYSDEEEPIDYLDEVNDEEPEEEDDELGDNYIEDENPEDASFTEE